MEGANKDGSITSAFYYKADKYCKDFPYFHRVKQQVNNHFTFSKPKFGNKLWSSRGEGDNMRS